MAGKVRLKHPKIDRERVVFDYPEQIKKWTDRGYKVVGKPAAEKGDS